MPRFPEESVACLKRTMLARAAQEFTFSPADVEAVVKETGLNQAQVQVWAENFRFRYTTSKERMDFLASDGFDKGNTVKMSRFFVACFNVTPEFAASFRFQKAKGQGDFTVKYMLAAFNKEAESGEFFIEFDEYVWEHKLIESFQAQGACQVSAITFAHNDGGDSAANALVRIMTSQKKSDNGITRGTCAPALYAKAYAKMEVASRQEQMASKEFDEKTKAAIMQSLQEMDGKVQAVNDNVQSYGVKLESIEGGVQSQAVDLVDIKQGVCNVIPDYQNEIKNLKEALIRKTAACDTIEGKLGHKTRVINQQDGYIAKLEEDQKLHFQEKQAWSSEKTSLLIKNSALQEELNQIRALKLILEKVDHIAEILSSTLAEERSAKRARMA